MVATWTNIQKQTNMAQLCRVFSWLMVGIFIFLSTVGYAWMFFFINVHMFKYHSDLKFLGSNFSMVKFNITSNTGSPGNGRYTNSWVEVYMTQATQQLYCNVDGCFTVDSNSTTTIDETSETSSRLSWRFWRTWTGCSHHDMRRCFMGCILKFWQGILGTVWHNWKLGKFVTHRFLSTFMQIVLAERKVVHVVDREPATLWSLVYSPAETCRRPSQSMMVWLSIHGFYAWNPVILLLIRPSVRSDATC